MLQLNIGPPCSDGVHTLSALFTQMKFPYLCVIGDHGSYWTSDHITASIIKLCLNPSNAGMQGVDVSRVLSHFSALSQGTSPRTQPVLPKTSYAKTKHVTVFEAYDEGSSEETDPLSSSESSYAESDRSFKTASMVYSNNRNNNITMNNNNNHVRIASQKDTNSSLGDEPDALKRDHLFVKFAESQEIKEVLQLYSDLKSELGLEKEPPTFHEQFHSMKQGLVGKVPDRSN